MPHNPIPSDSLADARRTPTPRQNALAQMQQDHQRQRAGLEPMPDHNQRSRTRPADLLWSRSHGEG